MLEIGYKDGLAILAKGKGVSAKEAYNHGLELMYKRIDAEYDHELNFSMEDHEEIARGVKMGKNEEKERMEIY